MANNTVQEDLLWPPRIDIVSVGVSAMSSFVAGSIGGIFSLLCTFFFLTAVETSSPTILPYVLSLVALVAILLTIYTQTYFNGLVFPNKYVRWAQETAQVFGFNLLMYILFTPLYVYAGGDQAELLMMVFSMHALIATLGSILIVEIIALYRYSLLALYSSFIGFFFATCSSFMFFTGTDISKKILYSLACSLVISIFAQTVFRTLFEFLYYKLYVATGMDLFWSVFAEIQEDETARVKEAEKSLTQFN